MAESEIMSNPMQSLLSMLLLLMIYFLFWVQPVCLFVQVLRSWVLAICWTYELFLQMMVLK